MTDAKIVELRHNLEVEIKEGDHVIACPKCAIGTVRRSRSAAKRAVAVKKRCFKCAALFEIISAKKVMGTEGPWEKEVEI